MTQKPRPGDRVRLVMLATVERINDETMTLRPDHMEPGQLCTVDLDGNLPITEVLERAQLDAAQAVAGDRISDIEDDWGTVIFNDAHGEQLLVAYDQLYGRALVAYDRVRVVRRPAEELTNELGRIVVDGVDFGDAADIGIPTSPSYAEVLRRQQQAAQQAAYREALDKAFAEGVIHVGKARWVA